MLRLFLAEGGEGEGNILSRTEKRPFLGIISSSSPSRARPPEGSYKFVCTFARLATIIAIGFAPISVASPT